MRTIKRNRGPDEEERLNEMLKICLQKVCQLQEELERTENLADPEAEGYATCVMETLRFLSTQGLPSNHPIVKGLTDKLLNRNDEES